MKLCMIGARGHSCYVTTELPRMPDVTLAGISAGDGTEPAALRNLVRPFQPAEYADWREMLSLEKPDILSVDGPFESHAEMCIAALHQNIHVFCEKPVALEPDDLLRVEDAWKESRVRLLSMMELRFEPHFYTAWKLAESGAVGKIVQIAAQKSYKLGSRPGFYKKRATYGGTIPWVGSHAIDWIHWFSGSPFASVAAVQTRENNSGNGDLETAAQCLFTMKNGILAQASIDYLRPGGAPTHGDDRLRVAGTAGILEVAGDRVTLLDNAGFHEIHEIQSPERGIFASFVAAIRGEGAAIASENDVFEVTRACLKARDAADKRQVEVF